MTTRESMRRELKDLAKMAAVMPKERPSAPPPSQRPSAPPSMRPSSPSISKLTVPPSVISSPVASVAQTKADRKKSRRGGLTAFAAVALIAAIAGGVGLGRTLANRASASRGPASAPVAAAAPATPAATATAIPTATPTEPVTTTAPATPPPPAAVAATPPPRPAVAPIGGARRAPTPKPATKPSLVANVPTGASGAMDPLEAAIRKAVAAPAKN
ncbi:MAG TPA: hypothetical protein VIF15_00465 [Polyangiaceae bacterium]|jgi:hypothetical protein